MNKIYLSTTNTKWTILPARIKIFKHDKHEMNDLYIYTIHYLYRRIRVIRAKNLS